MTRRVVLIAAVLAAGLTAPGAMAQEFDLPYGGEVRADPVGLPAPAYGPRTPADAYDNLSLGFGNGTGGNFLGTCENVIEDCLFSPGPWATATNRLIYEVRFGVAVITTPTTDEQILLIFWRRSDLNFEGWTGAGSGMLNPAAAPLAVARVDAHVLAPNFIYQFVTDLPQGYGVAIPDGDAGVAVQVAWVSHGCVPAGYQDLSACLVSACASTSTRGIAFGSNSLAPPGGNPATVGSTLTDYGRDISSATMCPSIGRFIGNGGPPLNTGNLEHRFITVTPTSGPNTGIPTAAGAQLLLRGDTSHCGTADFDLDGSPGTDADIAAFFACVAGNCCLYCQSADFNGDGDVGTDADIEAFFFVLGGGSC